MEALTTVLYVLVVIVCLALIGLILIQPSKGGGFGSALGGNVIGESVFGAYAGSHLTKLTVVLTTVLFVLTIFLAALVGRGSGGDSSIMDAEPDEISVTAPVAVPAPEALPQQ